MGSLGKAVGSVGIKPSVKPHSGVNECLYSGGVVSSGVADSQTALTLMLLVKLRALPLLL